MSQHIVIKIEAACELFQSIFQWASQLVLAVSDLTLTNVLYCWGVLQSEEVSDL